MADTFIHSDLQEVHSTKQFKDGGGPFSLFSETL